MRMRCSQYSKTATPAVSSAQEKHSPPSYTSKAPSKEEAARAGSWCEQQPDAEKSGWQRAVLDNGYKQIDDVWIDEA
eukprot:6285152-Prymnesium_polylepis.1